MRLGTFFTGLLLILAGVVLFLINCGYGSWTVLYELSKWWPLILIVIGLSMFGGGKIPYWLACLLIILSVGAVGFFTIQAGNGSYRGSTESALSLTRQQYPFVNRCHLDIDYLGGSLSVKPGGNDLLKADFGQKPIVNHLTRGRDTLRVNLSQPDYSWLPRFNASNRWQLWLSPELAWILDIEAAALNGHIDLSGIPLTQLDLNMGAGDMDLILGYNGTRSNVKIEAGAGDLNLHFPQETGVSITWDGALTSNNLDKLGWYKTGNRYTSPNYQQATAKIDCEIELSAGDLDVSIEPVDQPTVTT
ncbi:MAG: LiaI-LiaF-like domain-containing protein [Syntrophomonadaceae bacterium]|jgi:hypothetical protein